MALYEVQRLSGGGWRPYSAFDEKILAIDAAKDLMRGDRMPAAVRVMAEPDDGGPARMVFRQTAVDDHNEEVARRRREVLEAAEVARRVREQKKQEIRAERVLAQTPRRRGPAKRKPRQPGFTALMVRLGILLVAGGGALGVLRYYCFG